MKTYMNLETGSTGTYDEWDYENIDGELVNAVDLGEVVEVDLYVFADDRGETFTEYCDTLKDAISIAMTEHCDVMFEGECLWQNPELKIG